MKIAIALLVCLITAVYITAVVLILGKPKISGSLYAVDDEEDGERYLFLELSEENAKLNDGDLITFKVHRDARK